MINPTMWVNSVRSSGYRDAAMALGELIDNSLQAGASDVEVLVKEKLTLNGNRRTWNVQEIAVLDNGKGMDPVLQQRALRFGDGDHHKTSGGMGKYGVGLPQASISQAKRVDVWSWQDGVTSAQHTFINLADEEWVKRAMILPADSTPIPQEWLNNAEIVGDSGTLVVWSTLDRLAWKKAETIYTNSDFLVGRMYRHWLSKESDADVPNSQILLRAFDDDGVEVRSEWSFSPNDPLYLLTDNAANPSKQTKREVLFDKVGIVKELPFKVVNEDGDTIESTVKITSTMAPRALRDPYGPGGMAAGSTDYGDHARKNIGVSIVRANRELTLSTSFAIDKDPRHRWWGIQVEFGPELDEILGVTNNKQDAENLSSVARRSWDDYQEGNETQVQARKRVRDENYSQFVCIEIAHEVNKQISSIMTTIKKTSKDTKKKDSRTADSPERRGTEATKKRVEETGKTTDTDDDNDDLSKDERMELIKDFLQKMKVDPEQVEQNLGDIIDAGLRYSINHEYLETDAFFSVDQIGGAIFITLNRNHQAYSELFDTLGQDTSEATPQQMQQLLLRANSALLIMLIAWARLEDESSGSNKIRLQDARKDWGRIARDFLLFGRD